MSALGKDLPTSPGISMSPEEVDACVEQCFNFIQMSKNLGVCATRTSTKDAGVGSFMDSLTDDEVERLRKKMFSYWETTKHRRAAAGISAAALRHQESEPQSEEAVISFEDAKSEAAAVKLPVTCYNLEQLIEVELREIRNLKLSSVEDRPPTDSTPEAKTPLAIVSMDFTELKKKAADLPAIAGIETARRQEVVPVLKSTDTLEVLLNVYEYSNVDSTEKADVYLCIDESENRSINPRKEIKDFQLFLVKEMKIIYERLASMNKEIDVSDDSMQTGGSQAILSQSVDLEPQENSEQRPENTVRTLPAAFPASIPSLQVDSSQCRPSTSSSSESLQLPREAKTDTLDVDNLQNKRKFKQSPIKDQSEDSDSLHCNDERSEEAERPRKTYDSHFQRNIEHEIVDFYKELGHLPGGSQPQENRDYRPENTVRTSSASLPANRYLESSVTKRDSFSTMVFKRCDAASSFDGNQMLSKNKRFSMPFKIRCVSCSTFIPKGTLFNFRINKGKHETTTRLNCRACQANLYFKSLNNKPAHFLLMQGAQKCLT